MGCNGALVVCIELPQVSWIKRFPARPVLVVGFVLVGLGCASFAVAETLPGFFIAMSIYTLGEIISLPVSAAYSARLAPARFRGRYFGYMRLAWGIASLAGSAGVWAFSVWGLSRWIWSGGLRLITGGMMIPVFPDRRPN